MDKVRIATALFGRAGIDMLPMLQGGSDALREMQRDAERLGLTFSQADFAGVEQANDSIERLEASVGALKRQLAIDFAPLFTVVAETITEGMIGATEAVNDHTRSMAAAGQTYGLVAESVFGLADMLDRASQGVALVDLKIQDMTVSALTSAKAVAEMFGQTDQAAELGAAIDTITANMARIAIPLGFDMGLDKLDGAKMRTRYQEILDEISRAKPKTLGDSLVDVDAMKDMERKAEAMEVALRTPQEALTSRIVDANKMLDLGAISWQTYTREIAAARAEFERAQGTFAGATLLEEGTQAFYAAINKWKNQQKRMQGPLPGANLVMTEPPPRQQGLVDGLPVTRVTPIRQDNREVVDELKRTNERLDRIASETGRTTGASLRTANATEKLQMPATVDF
jgi:hypothetical protein